MSKPKEKHIDYFERAKGMVLASFGRLPTPLVIIFLLSMSLAAITGAVMQFSAGSKSQTEFMPQRLESSDNTQLVDLRMLRGNWIYQTPKYAMTLTLVDDRFEWIIAFGDIAEAQFFARGNFRIVGDVLILGVRPDLGSPRNPSMPWLKFMPIAMKDLNVFVKMQGKNLEWTVPVSEQKKILSYGGQIFFDNPDGLFEWVKP